MMSLYLGLYLLLVQHHAAEGFLPTLLQQSLSVPFVSGIHGHGNQKHRHHFTPLNLMNTKNLLADSTKIDTTTDSGSSIVFFMSEIASLTNIIAMPQYSSVTYTLDEMGRIKDVKQSTKRPDEHLNADEINEGRYYCMGDDGNPFEHMSLIPKTIETLAWAMSEYTEENQLPQQWEKKIVSIEDSPSNSLGPCTITRLLNDDDTVVLEVPLRKSYIVRNYSWMAQAHLTYLPHMEKDSPLQIFGRYGRWQIENDSNGKHDSLSFIGSPTQDMPDTINLPMTLVATWSGNSLIWGWDRAEMVGVDAESDVFSPRTLEHTHVFKDMDGELDPTAQSNNPITACTLVKLIRCTSREAAAFSQTAIANAKSNDFTGLYIANVGNGFWFFTFKKSDYESLNLLI